METNVSCCLLYSAGIQLWEVHLQGALCHLHSLSPWLFCAGYRSLVAFFSIKLFFIRSIDVRNSSSRQITTGNGARVSPCRTLNKFKEVCVFIRRANLDFSVNIERHYDCDGFLGETISFKYLLRLPFLYGIKCITEIYEQKCHLEVFCTNSFYDLTYCKNLWNFGSISLKTVLIFYEEFSQFLVRCNRGAEHHQHLPLWK